MHVVRLVLKGWLLLVCTYVVVGAALALAVGAVVGPLLGVVYVIAQVVGGSPG